MSSAGGNLNILRLIVALGLWFLVVTAVASYQCWSWLTTPVPIAENQRVVIIEKGDTLHRLSRRLSGGGMLRWPKVWLAYAKFIGATGINAGEYRLAEKESPVSLLARFQSGDVVQYQITLVEGLTVNDYLRSLHSHKKIKAVLPASPSIEQWREAGFDFNHPEGWFFPDTYHFSRNSTDVDILQRAYQAMRTTLQDEWQNRAQNLPYQSAYEALIMASIVEKETGVEFERPDIAGVFVRRLDQNMRLQTDPTVIYGMGERYQGNITREDLKQPTPYNTYVIKGLPPTPIAMPGRAAIHAALHPAGGSALYFVARGDGTHEFSKTLEQHVRAVNKYQKRRREDYRSSPPPEEAQQGTL